MKNYINQYKQTYKRIKDAHYNARLRDLKTWVQVKGPKPVQGILSFALDWLSPEFIGTGFRMKEISDDKIVGIIPYKNQNLDAQAEVHAGLILNAAIELVRVSLQKQMPDETFRIKAFEVKLSKNNFWKSDLHLIAKLSLDEFDDFFIKLQDQKKAEIVLEILIQPVEQKKSVDKVQLNLQIESILQIEE